METPSTSPEFQKFIQLSPLIISFGLILGITFPPLEVGTNDFDFIHHGFVYDSTYQLITEKPNTWHIYDRQLNFSNPKIKAVIPKNSEPLYKISPPLNWNLIYGRTGSVFSNTNYIGCYTCFLEKK